MCNPKCRDPRRSIGAARGQVIAMGLGGRRKPSDGTVVTAAIGGGHGPQ